MLVPPLPVEDDGDSSWQFGADEDADAPAAVPLPPPLACAQQQPAPAVTFEAVAVRAQRDHAAMHNKLLSIHAGIVAAAPLATKDAIAFFEDVHRQPANKQQLKGTCCACGKVISSTASSRLVVHITKCQLMPMAIVKSFRALKSAANDKVCGKREAELMGLEEKEQFHKKHVAEQAVLVQTGIKASMQGAESAWADRCIAEFFYANAIPFSVADTAAGGLYRRMVAAIKATPAGYRPPNFNKLGNELLDKCYEGLWTTMQQRDPDGALVSKYGSTYVTDGWDSCDNLSLINSAFITNNDGGLFWRSVDTSGAVKCAEYTAMLMIEDIYKYGPTKVVLVCTDTCAVMQKAWDIVSYEFPWVSCLPCQPHVISLLLKDIGKTPEVRQPTACARLQCQKTRTC